MAFFHNPVADEFQSVNQLILDSLKSDVGLVENIGSYIVDSGGKRLRPVLVLLSALANGYNDGRSILKSLRLSNLSTQQHCFTMMWLMSLHCAGDVRLPMRFGAMPPVFLWVTFFIPELFRCW